MKSLFSCFATKHSKKSKRNEISYDDLLKLNDNKPKADTISELNKRENVSNISVKSLVIDSDKSEKSQEYNKTKENTDCKDDVDINSEKNKEYEKRVTLALKRIDIVNKVLDGKCKMYDINKIIKEYEDVKNISFIELSESIKIIEESEINVKCQTFGQMIDLQIELLKMIQNREFSRLSLNLEEMSSLIIKINENCEREQINFELNRYFADSFMIFGWVNIDDNKPASFVNSVADSSVIFGNKLINMNKYADYSTLIKQWTKIIRSIANIVATNMELPLIWRVVGQKPLQPMQSIILHNYTNRPDDNSFIASSNSSKRVNTKRVDEVSCEDMSSLMNDLRSGRQRTLLRNTDKSLLVNYQAEISANTSRDAGEIESANQIPVTPGLVNAQGDQYKSNIHRNINNNEDFSIKLSEYSSNPIEINDCDNSSFHFDGLLHGANLDNCKNCNFLVEDVKLNCCLSIANCDNCQVQVIGEILIISVKGCKSIKIYVPGPLHKEFSLTTDNICTEIELYVAKSLDSGMEVNDYELHPIPSQSEIKFNQNENSKISNLNHA